MNVQVTKPTPDEAERYPGLLTDVLTLLSGQKSAHMARWAYFNGGKEYLEEFFKSPEYDGTKERAFIPTIAEQLWSILPDQISLIELGPGNAPEKSSQFISALEQASNGTKKIVSYTSLDFVPQYAQDAASYIGREHHITATPIVKDYLESKTALPTFAAPLLVTWNSPLWNSGSNTDIEPIQTYASGLVKLGRIVGPNGHILLTHFPALNQAKTEAIYNRDVNKNAVMAIPALIERALDPDCQLENGEKVGFSSLFNYQASWNPDVPCVQMCIVPKADATVKVGHEAFQIKQGRTLELVRSAKPTVGRFNQIATASGASLVDSVKNNDGTVVAQLVRFDRSFV